jgi:predicted transcriptional regulator
MRLHEVITLTEAQFLSPDPAKLRNQSILKQEVQTGFGADLMSDVLVYNVAHGLLITGLNNPQIVRTAEMADAAAILVVRGKILLPETIEVAQQVGIPIIGTQLTMFETCGRLYAAGLRAAPRHDEVD